eukprot:6208330-Pleurochrysis_carterae.AAC.1
MYIGILWHHIQYIQSYGYSGVSPLSFRWGHPVATLPSDGGDYTSLSLYDVNSANQDRGTYGT